MLIEKKNELKRDLNKLSKILRKTEEHKATNRQAVTIETYLLITLANTISQKESSKLIGQLMVEGFLEIESPSMFKINNQKSS